jgi:outer membrane protein OmpA-like peptidoglycan-associated protein
MRLTSTLTAGAVLGLFAALSATAASAATTLDAVVDSNKSFVRDSGGNCVRTQWDNATDPCAPPPAPVAETPAAAPAPVLAQIRQEETVVYFDFDKSNLTKQSEEKLSRLAGKLQGANEIVEADIVGYADPIGSTAYNQRLSQRRAQAVGQYLNAQGFTSTKTPRVEGLGETDAFARCEGIKQRAKLIDCFWKNRQVQVKLSYKDNAQAAR